METRIDRSTDQTVPLRGGAHRLDPNSVTRVERVVSFHQGRQPKPGERLALEIDGELDVMKAVAYIRSRIHCEMKVEGDRIFVRVGNLSDIDRLQKIVRKWADNESELARVDIYEDLSPAA